MPAPLRWFPLDIGLGFTSGNDFEAWLLASPNGRMTLPYSAASGVDSNIRYSVYNGALQSGNFDGLSQIGVSEHQTAGAFGSDGRLLLVWVEEPVAGAGDQEDVYAALFAPNQGDLDYVTDQPRFLVGGGALSQIDPVAAFSNGYYAVAYSNQTATSNNLIIDFYDAAANFISTRNVASTSVNQILGDTYRDIEITGLSNGNYAVTWTESTFDIKAQVYTWFGSISSVIDVEVGATETAWPDVTALADGRFAVTYLETDAGIVRGKIYNQDGSVSVNTFTIAASGATDAFNQQVQTAALNDGRFVTVWLDSAGHIQGRAMFADGTPDGNVFEVSATTAGGRPTIATLADGRFAVTWEQGAFGATQVKSAVFDPREARISQSATSFNDDWNGTAFGDTLFMGTGNDIARGGGAADFIFGEAGNDRLYGEDSDDRIDGGTGADTMIGGIGNDYYFVDNANDDVQEFFNEGIDTIRSSVSYQLGSDEDKLYITGAAANGIGNSLSNFIFGNANANVLDGLGGADRLYGLQGDDQYVVDSAGDLVFETIAGASGGLNDQVFSAVNHTLSNNVEKLTLIGGGNINGTGNSLINAIGGNGGNNFIDGKAGSDTLTGNGGSDQFLFTTTLNATTNTDTITDFDPANDFLRLDDAIFAQIAPGFLAATAFELGSVADTAGDRIVYNPATGDVFYDRDGVGGAAQVKFANVGAGTALTQADIFVF